MASHDLLHFVETDEFGHDWKGLGLDVERDLWALQVSIMRAPDAAPLIQNTGGLRKLRFSPPEWTRGKSGAVRVCYAYFPKHWTILLVMAYRKVEKDTISSREKLGIKQYLAQIEAWLDKRSR
jgi:hypothetical protein